jgi:hypothetical protein
MAMPERLASVFAETVGGDQYDEDYIICVVLPLRHGSTRTIGRRFRWQRKHEQFASDD